MAAFAAFFLPLVEPHPVDVSVALLAHTTHDTLVESRGDFCGVIAGGVSNALDGLHSKGVLEKNSNVDEYGCEKCIFFVRMRLFLMTSDTIDVLYFIFFKFVFKEIFKTRKKVFCIQIFLYIKKL